MARKRLDGAVDKEWTTASVKMAAATKEAWRRLAEAEGRSMGNYLERLLNREAMEHEVTLYDVMGRLEVIHALLVVKGGKVSKPEAKDHGPSPYDIDTGEIVTKETWHSWLNHLRGMGTRLNHYSAMKHFEQLRELYDRPEQWNCDELVKELIKQAARSIYLPYSFKKS
jgi:hypothetical protein